MDVTLVKPTIDDHSELREYVKELATMDDAEGSNGLYGAILSGTYSRWVENQSFKTSDTYLILNSESKIVGVINIRFLLNENLKRCGGNIGYNIRPSERRKGYAKAALKKALEMAADYGLDELFIDCYKDNIASSKTIESVGGVLIRDSFNEARGHSVLRYRVDLRELKQTRGREVLSEINRIPKAKIVDRNIGATNSGVDTSVDRYLRRREQLKEELALDYLKTLLSINPNLTEDMISPDIAKYLGIAKRDFVASKKNISR